MSTENLLIVTAQPEFAQAALTELKHIDKRLTSIEELDPGVLLCGIPGAAVFMHKVARERPIFVRHLAPVQATVELNNEEQDVGNIAMTIANLPTFAQLEPGARKQTGVRSGW